MSRAHACFCTGPESGQQFCPCHLRMLKEKEWPKVTPSTPISEDIKEFIEQRRKYINDTKDLDVGRF